MLTSQVCRENQDDACKMQAQGVAWSNLLLVKGNQEAMRGWAVLMGPETVVKPFLACLLCLTAVKEKKIKQLYHIDITSGNMPGRIKDRHDHGKHFSQRSQFLFPAPLSSPFIILTLNWEIPSHLLTWNNKALTQILMVEEFWIINTFQIINRKTVFDLSLSFLALNKKWTLN